MTSSNTPQPDPIEIAATLIRAKRHWILVSDDRRIHELYRSLEVRLSVIATVVSIDSPVGVVTMWSVEKHQTSHWSLMKTLRALGTFSGSIVPSADRDVMFPILGQRNAQPLMQWVQRTFEPLPRSELN